MDQRLFEKRLFDAVKALIPPRAAVLVAVSGGADSMALLHGLHAVNHRRRCGWGLHVAHLDHGLRADSKEDAEFVREAASQLALPCVVKAVDVAKSARTARETVEEAGRRLRYAFFEEAARSLGAKVVAMAHHAGDQAETVLYRIIRGTGLRGLAGMAASRPIRPDSDILVVRPLLALQRDDLLAYLERRGLPHRRDVTNDDASAAARNLIRHEVLPLLQRRLNPEAAAALVRLAAQAREAGAALELLAEKALNDIRIGHARHVVAMSTEGLAALPPALQKEVLVLGLKRLGASLKEVNAERIDAAVSAAITDKPHRRRIQLPGGVIVEWDNRQVSIRRKSE